MIHEKYNYLDYSLIIMLIYGLTVTFLLLFLHELGHLIMIIFYNIPYEISIDLTHHIGFQRFAITHPLGEFMIRFGGPILNELIGLIVMRRLNEKYFVIYPRIIWPLILFSYSIGDILVTLGVRF